MHPYVFCNVIIPGLCRGLGGAEQTDLKSRRCKFQTVALTLNNVTLKHTILSFIGFTFPFFMTLHFIFLHGFVLLPPSVSHLISSPTLTTPVCQSDLYQRLVIRSHPPPQPPKWFMGLSGLPHFIFPDNDFAVLDAGQITEAARTFSHNFNSFVHLFRKYNLTSIFSDLFCSCLLLRYI